MWKPATDEIGLGTVLVQKIGTNRKWIVTDMLPDIYLIQELGGSKFNTGSVSKIDVHNWFNIWPGHDEPVTKNETPVTYKYKCQEPGQEHELVNVSFMGMNLRCKHCDIAEKEIPKYASRI